MSGGKRQNIHGFERKRANQAARRPEHRDKYADRSMQSQMTALVEHFKSEERDNERP